MSRVNVNANADVGVNGAPPPSSTNTHTHTHTYSSSPITVSLEDLRSGTIPISTLISAFGPSSLGILVVRDLPATFPALRSRVLSGSSRLAHLPAPKLERLTRECAKYLVGWSHGKETLRPGVVDRAKGSFYVNCGFYAEGGRRGLRESGVGGGEGLDGAQQQQQQQEEGEEEEGFEEYTAQSVWPDEEDLPGFQKVTEDLITMIIDVAVLVARACDRYAADAVEGYQDGFLEHVVKTSMTTKARLLHYFPAEGTGGGTNGHVEVENGSSCAEGTDKKTDEDDWCATHIDHGCLTGLTSAMFVDESKTLPEDPVKPLDELPTSPIPVSGLYIQSRGGETVKVNIPRDCLAFQTGEALELITKGRFKAVPHFVRGVPVNAGGRVARNTLAVFTQPNLGELVDSEDGITFGDFARGVIRKNTA